MGEPEFTNESELRRWLETEKYPLHFEQCSRLIALAEEAMEKGGQRDAELSYPKAIALILAKAYKSFYSSVVLGRIGMTEDMGILVRSLLNLLIVAKWIAQEDREERASRYVQWFWVEMYRLLDQIQAPEDSRTVIEEEYEKRRVFFEVKKKGGKLPLYWHNSNIKTMARETGLLQHYSVVYGPLSATEHSSPLSYFGMLSESEAPETVTKIRLRDHSLVPFYLGYGFQYLAGILWLWNDEFAALDKDFLDAQIRSSLDVFKSPAKLSGSTTTLNWSSPHRHPSA